MLFARSAKKKIRRSRFCTISEFFIGERYVSCEFPLSLHNFHVILHDIILTYAINQEVIWTTIFQGVFPREWKTDGKLLVTARRKLFHSTFRKLFPCFDSGFCHFCWVHLKPLNSGIFTKIFTRLFPLKISCYSHFVVPLLLIGALNHSK